MHVSSCVQEKGGSVYLIGFKSTCISEYPYLGRRRVKNRVESVYTCVRIGLIGLCRTGLTVPVSLCVWGRRGGGCRTGAPATVSCVLRRERRCVY